MAPQGKGFDAIVGNPPFAGKNTIAAGQREGYIDWLKAVHPESHGASDLVAHFFRRAFTLVREEGAFGLIATNTVAQGDTRTTGLRWICTHGGAICAATRRYPWPGLAAVVVSVVHVFKGKWNAICLLDGREVPRITAYLFHQGGHENPKALKANADRSYQGSIVLGMGFTFDDRVRERSVANSFADMNRLIVKDPRNAERIFPYLGGEELNDHPEQAPHRHVINFGEMEEHEARTWPDLMAIVEAKVKPDRLVDNRSSYSRRWWQFAEKRSELYASVRVRSRVLVIARVSQTAAFVFIPANWVYADKVIVFCDDRDGFFATLQSRAHEVWARFFSSTMKDDLQYTPSDCFETFPFPSPWETDAKLEAVGKEYHEFRAALMVRNNEGLTATYNRFHSPDESGPDILKLRALHDAMDRAVLDAYGWKDLTPTCEFLLDYEEPEEAGEETRARRRKKPWRYRWPDATRDEVLARLLTLNAERAKDEAAAALTGMPSRPDKRKVKGEKRGPGQGNLF